MKLLGFLYSLIMMVGVGQHKEIPTSAVWMWFILGSLIMFGGAYLAERAKKEMEKEIEDKL